MSARHLEMFSKADLHSRRQGLDSMAADLVVQEPFDLFLVHLFRHASLMDRNVGSARASVRTFAKCSHDGFLFCCGGSFSDVPLLEAVSVLMNPV